MMVTQVPHIADAYRLLRSLTRNNLVLIIILLAELFYLFLIVCDELMISATRRQPSYSIIISCRCGTAFSCYHEPLP